MHVDGAVRSQRRDGGRLQSTAVSKLFAHGIAPSEIIRSVKEIRAWAIASTPCSPLPATTSALGYNEDRRQLQLMDGWQASEAWRANLRAEYILSEAGGRGRRRCGVGRAGYRPADDQWLNIVKWTHFGSQGLACARREAVEASMSLGKGLPHCCAIATGGD